MATRAYYQVKDDEGRVYATLFANGAHNLTPVEIAQLAPPPLFGPTTLLAHLLTQTYPSTHGQALSGQNVFWLVPSMEFDGVEFVQGLSVRNHKLVADEPVLFPSRVDA